MPSGESASPRPNVRNDSAGMRRESSPAVAVRTGGKESAAAFHGRLSGHSVVKTSSGGPVAAQDTTGRNRMQDAADNCCLAGNSRPFGHLQVVCSKPPRLSTR